jgi:hypothetical protein
MRRPGGSRKRFVDVSRDDEPSRFVSLFSMCLCSVFTTGRLLSPFVLCVCVFGESAT